MADLDSFYTASGAIDHLGCKGEAMGNLPFISNFFPELIIIIESRSTRFAIGTVNTAKRN